MCKFNPKNNSRRIDPCIFGFIKCLQLAIKGNHKIVACCCGHSKYPMTIIVKVKWKTRPEGIFDLVSGMEIPRKKRFYKKDKQGYYYIPEIISHKSSNDKK